MPGCHVTHASSTTQLAGMAVTPPELRTLARTMPISLTAYGGGGGIVDGWRQFGPASTFVAIEADNRQFAGVEVSVKRSVQLIESIELSFSLGR